MPREPQPATLELPVGRAEDEQVRFREVGAYTIRYSCLCPNKSRTWRRRYPTHPRARLRSICEHATFLRHIELCTCTGRISQSNPKNFKHSVMSLSGSRCLRSVTKRAVCRYDTRIQRGTPMIQALTHSQQQIPRCVISCSCAAIFSPRIRERRVVKLYTFAYWHIHFLASPPSSSPSSLA